MHLKFNKSFHILVIFIIFFVFAIETLSVDPNLEACMPQNCGNGPNISYPFWITNLHESYCGQPNFEVTCNGGNPVVAISDDDYVIEEIFYTNNSFLLANSMAYDFENTCPIPLHNFSIEETPCNYSLSYVDLFFFYNCSTYPINKPTYRVDCASNATDLSFAVFHKELLEYENYSIDSCNSWVNAPVETGDIKKLLEMNFIDVLRRGFVLHVGKFELKFTPLVVSLEMKGCVLLKDYNLAEESHRSLYIPSPSLHFGEGIVIFLFTLHLFFIFPESNFPIKRVHIHRSSLGLQ